MRKPSVNRLMLTVFILFNLVLSGCIGTSATPVIYVSPDTVTIYTTLTFSPEVEFPEGIPDQSDVVIRVNGKDVTAEFDLWDNGGDNKARISGQVDDGAYPIMLGSFRNGTNTFQVTVPSKSLIYFEMNLGGAEVHVSEVVDSYCGTVFIDGVGDSADLSDGTITDFDCSRYFFTRCVDPANVDYSKGGPPGAYPAGRDNLGNYYYKSILGAECDVLTAGGAAVPAYTFDTVGKGITHGMYIRGYFENNEAMSQMWHRAYSIDAAGAWTQETTKTVLHGESKTWVLDGNDYYFNLGTADTNCNGVTVDLDVNEFCMMVPDRDGVRIYGKDTSGTGYTEWIRSDVQQKDSRLGNGGVMGLRAEDAAMEAVLDVAGATVGTGENLIDPDAAEKTYIVDPSDPPPSFCPSCKWMSIELDDLRMDKLNMKSDFPTSPSGRLDMKIDIDCSNGGCGGRAIHGAGTIKHKCETYEVCIWGAGCTNYDKVDCALFSATGIDGPWDFDANADTKAEISIFLDGNYEMHTSTALPNFSLTDVDINIDSWLNGLVGLIADIIVPLMQGFIGDMVAGMIETLVDALFNVDLPLMRMAMSSIDSDGNATKIYMSLRPEIASFTTSENNYTEIGAGVGKAVSGELAFGLHATGKPRINQSIGSLYDSNAPIELFQVSTAKDDLTINDHNVGFTLHESFVNQLFMGLWESGILYIDFNAGNDPLINTFVDNANIKFASASPWTIGHLADITLPDGSKENERGDVKIDINDLLLHISGDVYDPFQGKWYYDRVLLEFIFSFEIYADLVGENGAFKIILDSNPTFELLRFYSDYIPLDEALGNSVLQQVVPMLVTEVGSISFMLPSIADLSLTIGDIWVPDTTNLGLTMDAWYGDVPVIDDPDPEPATGSTSLTVALFSAHNTYFRAQDGGTVMADHTYLTGVDDFFVLNADTAVDDCLVHGDEVWITTLGGFYWSAQSDGNLDSDRTGVGSWETFTFSNATDSTGCLESGDNIRLLGAHGQYVQAEDDGDAMADTTNTGSWETFEVTIDPVAAGSGSFATTMPVSFYNTTHKRYFRANGGGGDDLYADRKRIGTSEQFTITATTVVDNCIANGDVVSILANDGSNYWRAASGGNLKPDRTSIGTDERFVLTNDTHTTGCLTMGDSVFLLGAHNMYVQAEDDGDAMADTTNTGSWEKQLIVMPSLVSELSWNTGSITLANGEFVETEAYILSMQTDGNLVLYIKVSGGAPVARWASGTNGNTNTTATFQSNGNLVVEKGNGTNLWSSGTGGNDNAVMYLTPKGNLEIWNSSRTTLKWRAVNN